MSPYFAHPSLQLPQQPKGNPNSLPHAKKTKNNQHSNGNTTQPHQNLFSIFFPGTGPGGIASGSGFGSGSGSASPVIDGSPLGDRGRRRTKARGRARARTRTATQRDQDGVLVDILGASGIVGDDSRGGYGDGGDGDDDGADRGEDDEDEEGDGGGEFSDLLADAIFKRPESICGGSFRAKREKAKEKGKVVDVGGSGTRGGRKDEGRALDIREINGDGDGDDDGWIKPGDTSMSSNDLKKPMASMSVGESDEG